MNEPNRYSSPSTWVDFAQTLPQIKHIKPDAIQRWADHLSQLPLDQANFHAQRVRGFGGSEIGVLLTEAKGGRDSWNTANWIVRQKLLELLPLPPEPHMLRGQVLEPIARAAFMRPRGNRLDRDGMRAIGLDIDKGKYSWMQGNADLAIVQRDRRYLIEFKNPGFLPAANDEIEYRYAVQALFYEAKAEKNGVKFDGVLLVHYRIEGQDGLAHWMQDEEIRDLFVRKIQGSLKRGQEPLIELVAQQVPRDPEIVRDIGEVGSDYWNGFVMKGLVPGLPKKPELKLSQEDIIQGQHAAYEYLRFKSLETAAKEQASQRASVLSSMASIDRNVKMPFGVTVQHRSDFDLERAEGLLKAKGHPLLRYCDETWNIPEMTRALDANGVDVEQFRLAGKINLDKVRGLLDRDEIELLTSAKPVISIHARSPDPRVTGAIADATEFVKDSLDGLGEVMTEQFQAHQAKQSEEEVPQGGRQPRSRKR